MLASPQSCACVLFWIFCYSVHFKGGLGGLGRSMFLAHLPPMWLLWTCSFCWFLVLASGFRLSNKETGFLKEMNVPPNGGALGSEITPVSVSMRSPYPPRPLSFLKQRLSFIHQIQSSGSLGPSADPHSLSPDYTSHF